MSDGKVRVDFLANTKGLLSGVDAATGNITSFGNAVKKTAFIVGAASIAIGVDSVKQFAKFEQGMREVSTLSNFTSKQMKAMSKETKSMARTFGQDITKLTKARYDVVSAGFADITEQTMLLTQANKLAIAGVTDVATSTDALTSVLNAYGKETYTAEQAADILFTTVKQGKTTVDELSSAIGKVLPTAKSAGVSFEQVGASIATMTAAGIKTPQAVTALNSVLFGLSAPASEAAKNMKELGINTTDTAGKMLPLVDILSQFEGMSLAEVKKFIPSEEAAKALLSLSGNLEGFTENLKGQVESAGNMEAAYVKMSETTQHKFNQLARSTDTLKITFGEFLATGSGGKSVIDKIIGVMGDWEKMLTLDEKGVSRLRKEWNLLVEDVTGFKPDKGVFMDALKFWAEVSVGQRDIVKETNMHIDKLQKERIRKHIENGKIGRAEILFSTKRHKKRLVEVYKEMEAEKQRASFQSSKILKNQFIKMISGFKGDAESAAPATAAPMVRQFSAAGSQVADGFEKVVSGMKGAASSGLSGAFGSLPRAMNRGISPARVSFNNFIREISNRTVTVTVKTKTVDTSPQARGGLMSYNDLPKGYAAGGSVSDTIPAMLTRGEFVVRQEATERWLPLLKAINKGAQGFAMGGLVQGFQRGGPVDFGPILQTQGKLPTGLTEEQGAAKFERAFEEGQKLLEVQKKINEDRQAAQLEANNSFTEMMDGFQQGITDMSLEKMDERERLFIESQQRLSEIMMGPYSDEQKELLAAASQALYDTELAAFGKYKKGAQKNWGDIKKQGIKAAQQLAVGGFGLMADSMAKMIMGTKKGGKEFGKAMQGMVGDAAATFGKYMIAKGVASIADGGWPPNPHAVGMGLAQIAAGTALMTLGKGMSAAGSSGGGAGGGASAGAAGAGIAIPDTALEGEEGKGTTVFNIRMEGPVVDMYGFVEDHVLPVSAELTGRGALEDSEYNFVVVKD